MNFLSLNFELEFPDMCFMLCGTACDSELIVFQIKGELSVQLSGACTVVVRGSRVR